MFLVGILSWWYGQGWQQRILRIRSQLSRSADFFSIGLLARTLFSPFRQISAGSVRGPIGVQLRAFADQLVSRIIGAIVRFFTILCGIVVMTLQTLYGLIILLVWFYVPLFPVIGILMAIIGWVPTWSL